MKPKTCQKPSRRGACLGFAATLWLGLRPARAQPAVAPEAPVLALRAELLALAADWPPAATRLMPLVTAAFDLRGITGTVLGEAAGQTSPEQLERFTRVFGLRMNRALVRSRAPTEDDRFAVQETRPLGPAKWLVLTRSERPDGPLVLGWRIRLLPEGPRIVDLLADGVSAVQVQRQDLASALRTRSLDALLLELERRAAPERG
jgi:ABC-type transporter MlaC component